MQTGGRQAILVLDSAGRQFQVALHCNAQGQRSQASSCSQHDAVPVQAYMRHKRMGKRPRHRTRCCGLFGPQVDSLAYHLRRVRARS